MKSIKKYLVRRARERQIPAELANILMMIMVIDQEQKRNAETLDEILRTVKAMDSKAQERENSRTQNNESIRDSMFRHINQRTDNLMTRINAIAEREYLREQETHAKRKEYQEELKDMINAVLTKVDLALKRDAERIQKIEELKSWLAETEAEGAILAEAESAARSMVAEAESGQKP